MTSILTLISSTGRTSATGGQKQPQRGILDNIAKTDPDKAQKTEERLGALQDTMRQMQQMRQDQSALRKEAARQKIARIKAQIQALKLSMGGDAKANARQLARLARELQQAARAYKAAGGMETSGGTSVNARAVITDEGADTAIEATVAGMSPFSAEGIAAGGADEGENAEDGDAPAQDSQKARSGNAEEDRAFAEEARRLQRQIKQMLESQKRRLVTDGTGGSGDISRAERALRDVERQLSGLETAAISVDIKV
ncbi:MAG: hypothetical protein H3C49_03550 [Alphaproteobacteria bacterium]|nr:hypothetical protein [Alphaproteobacteria bacterium]